MIKGWEEYFERQFETDPNNGSTLWRLGEDLRPQMTGKFRRIYDRVQRRVEREMTPFAYIVRDSRQYVGVTAWKYKARRSRKHKRR